MASTAGKARDASKIRRGRQLETISRYMGVLMVIFIIFVLSGGVYDIIESPPASLQTSSGTLTSISPYAGEQTMNESIVIMFLYSCCFVGLFLVGRSSQVLYDKSKANLSLMIGLGLALIGFTGAYVVLMLKG
jgi:OST3 / OST6 family, transporter family